MPMTSVAFDAVLYGSPNFELEGGARRFMKRYAEDGSDNMFLPEYRQMLDTLGEYYLSGVRDAFERTHGRSGETVQSMHSEFETFSEPGVAGAFRYRVIIGGNVGYVINPIAMHIIPGNVFLNLQTEHEGRSTNFYSPFDWVDFTRSGGGVLWYQGLGGESYSPDRSWYESKLPELTAMATDSFRRVASRVALLWGQDGAAAEVPLTAPFMYE